LNENIRACIGASGDRSSVGGDNDVRYYQNGHGGADGEGSVKGAAREGYERGRGVNEAITGLLEASRGTSKEEALKIKFKSVNFRPNSLECVGLCNEIIEQYQSRGLRLTLRQLYYQLVIRNAVPNVEQSYKRLSTLVSDARLAGLTDWDAIEDRVRQPRIQNEFTGLPDLVSVAIRAYRLPRWKGQEWYVELWVEKDALAGILAPLASEFHVTVMVNRGYSSQSAMFESAKRFLRAQDRRPLLYYLGDHDPSGEDMVRDIRDRLRMFGVENIAVEKLALTMTQVERYNPPPNPTKVSDPRAEAYIRGHGHSSWEVDALPPEVLSEIIRNAFSLIVDRYKMAKVIRREERDKKFLQGQIKSK